MAAVGAVPDQARQGHADMQADGTAVTCCPSSSCARWQHSSSIATSASSRLAPGRSYRQLEYLQGSTAQYNAAVAQPEVSIQQVGCFCSCSSTARLGRYWVEPADCGWAKVGSSPTTQEWVAHLRWGPRALRKYSVGSS
jgi:hypothetical protein